MVSHAYNPVLDIGSWYINKLFSTTMSEHREAEWAHRELLLMSEGLSTSCQTSRSSLLSFRVQTHWSWSGNLVLIAPSTKLGYVLQVLQIDWVEKSQNLSHGFGKGDHGENQGSVTRNS
jgi:hypothetical protein